MHEKTLINNCHCNLRNLLPLTVWTILYNYSDI